MITGQFTGQIFSQKLWNKKVMDYYESINNTEWMKDIFVSEMDDNTIINSLNLNKVYIITSGNTASASEMVINGLSPFINVIQVGQTTYGKNVGGLAVVYDLLIIQIVQLILITHMQYHPSLSALLIVRDSLIMQMD